MFNPRFPHTLTVKRPQVIGGMPVVDSNGDAVYETVTLTLAEMRDSEPVLNADGGFVTYTAQSVAFGYRTSSRNAQTSGDVIVADFKIACPIVLTEILAGDELVLTDYERTYRGRVVKKTTFNLGTNIWFDEIRN